MNTRLQFLWIAVPLFVFIGVPVVLAWGWTRWSRDDTPRTISKILSLVGFSLASLSAALGLGTALYATVHHFPFYDPTLMRIYALGTLLSLGGIAFALAGVWRRSPLRWHALLSSIGMLCFWFIAASTE